MIDETNTGAMDGAATFAALRVLLNYLFLQVRMRDGVPQPPLFDRLDFESFVDECLHAPAALHSPQERLGLACLAAHMQQICRPDPGE
jgi:hypothetical protein